MSVDVTIFVMVDIELNHFGLVLVSRVLFSVFEVIVHLFEVGSELTIHYLKFFPFALDCSIFVGVNASNCNDEGVFFLESTSV